MALIDSALNTAALGVAASSAQYAGVKSQISGIQWGTGAPTHVAPQGTIYIQIDANAAAGEPTMWIKRSGGQAIPTAAGWADASLAYTAIGSLTNAQILTASSVPIDAIAAVANKIIIPDVVIWRANAPAVGYSANSQMTLRYAGIAIDLVTAVQTVNVAVQNNTMFWATRVQSVNSFGSGIDIRGVKVQIRTSADVTGGDVANDIGFQILYRVIDRP